MLTVAEARTKHCPKQYTAEHGAVCCNATDCMAWRWEAYRKPEDRGGEPRGYCGAFGIPLESIV